MIIESVFEYQHAIPSKYTYDGENISPPLKFLQIPLDAKSLVLIVDDPDAPHGVFDHWVMWNISPKLTQLSEGAQELKRVSPQPKEGVNGFGKKGYYGPRPPPGKPHRYFFKLYALDSQLALPEEADKRAVEQAMEGHIIAQAELMGTYQR